MALMELRETAAVTDNTRLAACLRVLQAELIYARPWEWANRSKTSVAFHFDVRTLPSNDLVQAFETPLNVLNDDLEFLLSDLPQYTRNDIRDAVRRLMLRACHVALLKREELVKMIKKGIADERCSEV